MNGTPFQPLRDLFHYFDVLGKVLGLSWHNPKLIDSARLCAQ